MSSVKSFAQRASALAFGIAALAGPALADDSHYSGVKAMDVFLPNAVPEITIGNIAANHLLANLDLAIQETTIAVVVGGYVEDRKHTSELQSLMRNSYAVFCLKKKSKHTENQ